MSDYTAKVIAMTPVVDSMLSSSSVPESDYPAWVAATAYVVGAFCIRAATHRIYKRVVAGTTPTAPESDSANWQDTGPTNRWAAFDGVVGTSTVATTALSWVMRPGSISGMTLLDVFGGSASIVLKDAPGGTVVYRRDVEIDSSQITDVYDWCYQPPILHTNVVLSDLPFHFPECELFISVAGTGAVSVGVCAVGEVIGIGKTLTGATSGISSFSGITVDTWGRHSIVKRKVAKKMSIKVMVEHSDYDRVSRALAALDAVFSIWIATEQAGFEPLTIYGKFKDFSIEVPYQDFHFCSLDIEGVV